MPSRSQRTRSSRRTSTFATCAAGDRRARGLPDARAPDSMTTPVQIVVTPGSGDGRAVAFAPELRLSVAHPGRSRAAPAAATPAIPAAALVLSDGGETALRHFAR